MLQRLPLSLLYVYVAVLGTLGAIGIPASQSLLPFIVRSEQLGLANGVVMATMQGAQMVAPLAAGWMIWFCRRSRGVVEGGPDLVSIGLALGVDAIAAASAALLVLFIKRHPAPLQSEKLFDLLQQGLRFCWREKNICRVLGYVMLISFFVQGPLLASLPLIAKFQLGLQERGYGTLYAMLGAGTIAGAGLAILLKPSAQKLGMVVLFCDLMIGLCLYNLGQVHSAGLAASILFLIGNGLGVTMVAGTTWFQTRTPGKYMGRVMSFLMFAVIGLIPLSAILTGFLVSFMSVNRILNVAGGVTIVFTITGLLIPSIRRMGDIPEAVFNEEKSPALTLEHRETRDAMPSTID
jgi:MFS family permease